jgi:hypothetical protein
MNTIHWLPFDQLDEWDAFVTRHPMGSIYHLSSWRQVLEGAFSHIRGQFLVLRDAGGQIQAGLPVYTVRSWILGTRVVSVPFATMCDPLISNKEEFTLLWPAIQDIHKKYRGRRVEIRARRTRPDCLSDYLTANTKYKHHYLPLCTPLETLFRCFDKSNIRRGVEKAKREGVEVVETQDEQSLRVLHTLIAATRRRRSLPPIPFAFFRAMKRSLGPERVTLRLAVHDGKPIGGIMVLKFKNMWTAEYSGTADQATRGVSPLLYWAAIQSAKNSGAEFFSFGRTSLDNTGLIAHKRRWATHEEELTDFIGPREDLRLVQKTEIIRKDNATIYGTLISYAIRYAPAGVQKLVGDFCYRHLG